MLGLKISTSATSESRFKAAHLPHFDFNALLPVPRSNVLAVARQFSNFGSVGRSEAFDMLTVPALTTVIYSD